MNKRSSSGGVWPLCILFVLLLSCVEELVGEEYPCFDSVILYEKEAEPVDIDVTDVDGDGLLDVVTYTGKGKKVEVGAFLNRSNGTTWVFSPIRTVPSERGWKLRFADINNDGMHDIVAPEDSSVSIYHGPHENATNDPVRILFPYGSYPDCLFADMNGDGHSNAVCTAGGIYQILWAGGGLSSNTFAVAGELLALGDVNGDGAADAIRRENTFIHIYTNDQSGNLVKRGPIFYLGEQEVSCRAGRRCGWEWVG